MNNPPGGKKPEPPKPADKKPEPMNIEKPKIEKKKPANKLMVEEALNDENSTIVLNSKKLAELNLAKGEQVILKGKKKKETLVVVLPDPKGAQPTEEG